MLALKQVELPVDVKQSRPIGGAFVQLLRPFLEEKVAVGANRLFLFNGQPGPRKGRVGRAVFLQGDSLLMVEAPEGRSRMTLALPSRARGAERDAESNQVKGTSEYNISKICCKPKV